jgi:hypothetical protein
MKLLSSQIKINEDFKFLGIFGANKYISGLFSQIPDEDFDTVLQKSFKKIVKLTPDDLAVEQVHTSVMIRFLQSRLKKVNSVLEFKTNATMFIKREMLSLCQEHIEDNRKRMFSELSQEIDIY